MSADHDAAQSQDDLQELHDSEHQTMKSLRNANAAPNADANSTDDVVETITVLQSGELQTNEVGSLLDTHKFTVARTLGKGGMGQVDLARDMFLERHIAIKRPLKGSDASVSVKLIHEAKVLGQLDHPNLPTVFSLETDASGTPFYTMRFEGETSLAALISKLTNSMETRQEFANLAVKLDIFQGLLQALIYAHNKSLLHRDIKPANIMVGPCGEVKLIDWGISSKTSATSSITERESFTGTPCYASPEQVGGSQIPIDERSDLYSAFVTLFELLTLQPYIAKNMSLDDTLKTVKTKVPPSVDDICYTQIRSGILPKEFRYYLAKGLANSADDRFKSAEEALKELRDLRQGNLQNYCVVTAIKKFLRNLDRSLDRRPRVVSLGLVLGTGTLAILAAFGLWQAVASLC